MRSFPALLLGLAITFCQSNPTFAQEPRIYGMGNQSCGSYLKARTFEGPEQLMFHAWLGGFLSSVSLTLHRDVLNGTDLQGALYWLDNYCRDHPVDNFASATTAFAVAMQRRR